MGFESDKLDNSARRSSENDVRERLNSRREFALGGEGSSNNGGESKHFLSSETSVGENDVELEAELEVSLQSERKLGP